MEKTFASRLKTPSSTLLPVPKSRLLKPLTYKTAEDAIKQAPRRVFSRRSRSCTDLTNIRPLASQSNNITSRTCKPTIQVASSTSRDRLPTKPILKTISEFKSSSTTTVNKTTLKRPTTNKDEPIKPKILKPAKPAPYDYKARFNLLNEKFTNLCETHKKSKQTIIDLEMKLENFIHLEAEHQELEKRHNRIGTEQLLAQAEILKLTKEKASLKNELESLNKEHDILMTTHMDLDVELNQVKNKYSHVLTSKQELEKNLDVAQKEIHFLQNSKEELKAVLLSQEELRRSMHNLIQDLKGTIRVFCRVRPQKEDEYIKSLCDLNFTDDSTLEIKKNREAMKTDFVFDKVFPPEAGQAEVFEELSHLVQSALDGYHICVFAYGQTGSGKTFTMQGEDDGSSLGMIPRTVDHIFTTILKLKKLGWTYKVEVSILEIYNEILRDLLDPHNKEKKEIRFNEGRGTTVTNLTITEVESAVDLQQLLFVANKNRAVATTNLNEHSSRSHAVTKITLSGFNSESKICYLGSLNLVDLAGSESAKTSSTDPDRITETKNINKSLSNLGTVMCALHNKENHIPYRNSKLTYLLQSCLGGNSKTLMFVNIAPFEQCYSESINALRFAAKVKEVKIGLRRNKTYA